MTKQATLSIIVLVASGFPSFSQGITPQQDTILYEDATAIYVMKGQRPSTAESGQLIAYYKARPLTTTTLRKVPLVAGRRKTLTQKVTILGEAATPDVTCGHRDQGSVRLWQYQMLTSVGLAGVGMFHDEATPALRHVNPDIYRRVTAVLCRAEWSRVDEQRKEDERSMQKLRQELAARQAVEQLESDKKQHDDDVRMSCIRAHRGQPDEQTKCSAGMQ